MRRGQHAADDGSFGRSAGGAMARGIALIVAAVLLGVILLRATDSPEPFANIDTEVDDEGEGTTVTTDPTITTETTAAPATVHNPAEVTVLVANGAGIPGLASKIGDQLKGANFVVAEPGNTKAPADESAVFFTPGYEGDAAAIAALLSPPPKVAPLPDPPPVDDMKSAHVLVVAAADLAAASG
ncbi:MAG TPA: LytR C-terminal domain-containing protein [Acidimicrobiales bacterium]|nr:LytR C-terminal domain-containing protein [Acidimicrobiales bacterium]